MNKKKIRDILLEIKVPAQAAAKKIPDDLYEKIMKATDVKTVLADHPDLQSMIINITRPKMAKMMLDVPLDTITADDVFEHLDKNKADRKAVLDIINSTETPKNEAKPATAASTADKTAGQQPQDQEVKAYPASQAPKQPDPKQPEPTPKSANAAEPEKAAESPKEKTKADFRAAAVSGITDELMQQARLHVMLTQDSSQKGLKDALGIGAARARAILEGLEKEGVVGPKPENSFERRAVRMKFKPDFVAAVMNSTDPAYTAYREILAKAGRSSAPGAHPA